MNLRLRQTKHDPLLQRDPACGTVVDAGKYRRLPSGYPTRSARSSAVNVLSPTPTCTSTFPDARLPDRMEVIKRRRVCLLDRPTAEQADRLVRTLEAIAGIKSDAGRDVGRRHLRPPLGHRRTNRNKAGGNWCAARTRLDRARAPVTGSFPGRMRNRQSGDR